MIDDATEARDLLLGLVVLSVAFTFFLGSPEIVTEPALAARLFVLCAVTAGSGFLAHELAHKVVAQRLGRVAAFQANLRLLGITLISGLAGFLFAAPGAVTHRGPSSIRDRGLVAIAGPLANLVLILVFVLVSVLPHPVLFTLGAFGIWINALLAGFNLLPVGPLDGKTVWRWHRGLFLVVAIPVWAIAAMILLPV